MANDDWGWSILILLVLWCSKWLMIIMVSNDAWWCLMVHDAKHHGSQCWMAADNESWLVMLQDDPCFMVLIMMDQGSWCMLNEGEWGWRFKVLVARDGLWSVVMVQEINGSWRLMIVNDTSWLLMMLNNVQWCYSWLSVIRHENDYMLKDVSWSSTMVSDEYWWSTNGSHS